MGKHFRKRVTPQGAHRHRPIGVDLFAGAGGFSLGAWFAGIDIIAAVEWDRHACRTYRTNLVSRLPSRPVLFERDIMEGLTPRELMLRAKLRSGDCDILIGGPPCQGFSSHRINDSGVDDPRNRLLLRYFEFVEALRPRYFLVENVPGMLWPRHKPWVDAFFENARRIGYQVDPPHTLNARSYGVPQNRRRVFLLGRDLERPGVVPLNWPPNFSHHDPEIASQDGLPPWRTASIVFEAPFPEGDPNNIHMNHSDELTAWFEKTPINGGSRKDSGRLLPCHEDHDGHSDVYGRIDPGELGPTMTTACINPSKGRFVHPTEHHGITLRQAARFQTFPDWFVFAGGLMAGGTQVGNAVPVTMGQALLRPIAREVRKQLLAESALKMPSDYRLVASLFRVSEMSIPNEKVSPIRFEDLEALPIGKAS